MIYWLVQSDADLAPFAHGVSPDPWLSPAEEEQLNKLTVEKRRHDWLLGRWTAKRLVQTVIEQVTGELPPLPSIRIERAGNGAPRLALDWSHPAWQTRLAISISHSGDRAFCAVAECPPGADCSMMLGADMERCETRPDLDRLVQDYLTPDEQVEVEHIPATARDLMFTAVWSAKEAALKALEWGLSADTRVVSCNIRPTDPPPEFWRRFELRWDNCRLKDPCGELPGQGWWRMMDNYVLTLVAGRMVST